LAHPNSLFINYKYANKKKLKKLMFLHHFFEYNILVLQYYLT
jgi:hypothetical protein